MSVILFYVYFIPKPISYVNQWKFNAIPSSPLLSLPFHPKNYVFSIYDWIRLHIPYKIIPRPQQRQTEMWKKTARFGTQHLFRCECCCCWFFFVIHLFRLLISLLICIIINSAIENRFSILFDTVVLHYMFMHGYWLFFF